MNNKTIDCIIVSAVVTAGVLACIVAPLVVISLCINNSVTPPLTSKTSYYQVDCVELKSIVYAQDLWFDGDTIHYTNPLTGKKIVLTGLKCVFIEL